jgi:hypothetical protein
MSNLWRPTVNRYNNDWVLNREDPIWRDCVLFLGGKGSGTTAIDSSGRGNHGTLGGVQSTAVPALHRKGWLGFSGTDDIAIPNFTLAESYTLAIWARSDSFANGRYFYIYSGGDGLQFGPNTGSLLFYAFGPNTSVTYTNSVYYNGDWHLWVARRVAGDKCYIYQDGNEVQSAADNGATGGTTSTLYVGNDLAGTKSCLGDLGDPIVWNRALSLPEIRQLASLRPDLNGAIRSTVPRFRPTVITQEEEEASTTYGAVRSWRPVVNRFNNDWELDLSDSLWRDCVLFLGGKGSGTTAIDSSPNRITATHVGTSLVASPHLHCKVFNFSVDGQYVDVQLAGSVIGTKDFAFYAWVWLAASHDDYPAIFGFGDTSSGEFMLRVNSGGDLSTYGSNGSMALIGDALPTETWVPVAVTRIGETLTIWQNQIATATIGSRGADISTSKTMRLGGADTAGNRNWQGYIGNPILLVGDGVYHPELLSLRPDLDGAIRSTVPRFRPTIVVGTEEGVTIPRYLNQRFLPTGSYAVSQVQI